MALYIVHKKNPYFPNGTVIELFEHGFQKAKVTAEGKVVGNEGLVHLESAVKPYCMKMLNRGLDKPELRTRKSAPVQSNDFDWERENAVNW